MVCRPVQRRQLPLVLCVNIVAETFKERKRDRVVALRSTVHGIYPEEVCRMWVSIHLHQVLHHLIVALE